MKLYVEPMDAILVEVGSDGRVRFEDDDKGAWATPNLQERRAIIYAARKELEALAEVLDILDPQP